jgi:hypothetical protein
MKTSSFLDYVPVASAFFSFLALVIALYVYLNFKKLNIFTQWVTAQGGKYYDRENTVRRLIESCRYNSKYKYLLLSEAEAYQSLLIEIIKKKTKTELQ